MFRRNSFILIVIHRQTVFVLSELFSVARHAGRSDLGSKPIQLYVSLSRRTSPGDNTPRDANCTATCQTSRKLYRLDEPDTLDTAGEARTSS